MANGNNKRNGNGNGNRTAYEQAEAARKRGPTAKESLRAGLQSVFGSGAVGRTKEKIKQKKMETERAVRESEK